MPTAGAPIDPPPAPHQLRASTGAIGERAAAEHLTRLGLRILARNFRGRDGEIDLIASDAATIVFAEVKSTRRAAPEQRGEALGLALERVLARQRARIRRAALDWLREQPTPLRAGRSLRFDAIAVVLDAGGRLAALEHVEDAF